jgi:hypothetical protein
MALAFALLVALIPEVKFMPARPDIPVLQNYG